MRAQASTVAAVLMVLVATAVAFALYKDIAGFQSNLQSSSTAQESRLAVLPPVVDAAYFVPPTMEHRKTTLCALVRNMSDVNLPLGKTVLYLYHEDQLIYVDRNPSDSCGGVLPGSGVCRVCADVIVPSAGSYRFKLAYGVAPSSQAAVDASSEDISLYPDLVVQSIHAYQKYYASNTLLFGDYNAATIAVTVCNTGRTETNGTAELLLSATNAHLSQRTFEIPELNAGHCVTFSTDGNTTNYYDVAITADINYPFTELSAANDRSSASFVNAYFTECNSCGSCNSDLALVTNSGAEKAFVVVTKDFNGSVPCINVHAVSGVGIVPYGGSAEAIGSAAALQHVIPPAEYPTVFFDGNGHVIQVFGVDNSYTNFGFGFVGIGNIHIVRLNLIGNNVASTVFIAKSTTYLNDVNILQHGGGGALYLAASDAYLRNARIINIDTIYTVPVELSDGSVAYIYGGYVSSPASCDFFLNQSALFLVPLKNITLCGNCLSAGGKAVHVDCSYGGTIFYTWEGNLASCAHEVFSC